jgi:hypothetical protein
MKKLICIFGILFLTSGLALAQGIPGDELINNAKLYNGKIVSYKGEAIGEVMRRGDYAWVNIREGNTVLGIWLPFALAKEIAYAGSYNVRGDIVEVTGVFNRACPEHGGDLDIHAQALRKIVSGKQVKEKLNPAKANQALILLGVLFLVWILTLFLRK